MIRLSPGWSSVAPPGRGGQRQEAPAADAGARFAAKQRRRYVVTTDSDHDGPIYPDVAKNVIPDRPNQVWSLT